MVRNSLAESVAISTASLDLLPINLCSCWAQGPHDQSIVMTVAEPYALLLAEQVPDSRLPARDKVRGEVVIFGEHPDLLFRKVDTDSTLARV